MNRQIETDKKAQAKTVRDHWQDNSNQMQHSDSDIFSIASDSERSLSELFLAKNTRTKLRASLSDDGSIFDFSKHRRGLVLIAPKISSKNTYTKTELSNGRNRSRRNPSSKSVKNSIAEESLSSTKSTRRTAPMCMFSDLEHLQSSLRTRRRKPNLPKNKSDDPQATERVLLTTPPPTSSRKSRHRSRKQNDRISINRAWSCSEEKIEGNFHTNSRSKELASPSFSSQRRSFSSDHCIVEMDQNQDKNKPICLLKTKKRFSDSRIQIKKENIALMREYDFYLSNIGKSTRTTSLSTKRTKHTLINYGKYLERKTIERQISPCFSEDASKSTTAAQNLREERRPITNLQHKHCRKKKNDIDETDHNIKTMHCKTSSVFTGRKHPLRKSYISIGRGIKRSI